jgi:ribonuclease P protein subunit POP4
MIQGKRYEINKQNLKNHELIGLEVKVVDGSASERIGIKGIIKNETKNTFVLDNGKILPKKECVFEFDIGEKVIVNGKDILKKGEDRIKG